MINSSQKSSLVSELPLRHLSGLITPLSLLIHIKQKSTQEVAIYRGKFMYVGFYLYSSMHGNGLIPSSQVRKPWSPQGWGLTRCKTWRRGLVWNTESFNGCHFRMRYLSLCLKIFFFFKFSLKLCWMNMSLKSWLSLSNTVDSESLFGFAFFFCKCRNWTK